MTEFDDVIQLLEENRPQATDLELDAIKQRVRRDAANPSRRRNQSMKSRVAILGMLVAGMLFSTAGAGLAVSGLGSDTNASVAQYGTPTPTPTPTPVCTATPTPTPTGTTPSATGNTEACSNAPEGGVLPAEAENAPSATSTAAPSTDSGVAPATSTNTQPAAQEAVAATSGQLPFTGFAAIPVMLGGLALLGGGMVLRRRTH